MCVRKGRTKRRSRKEEIKREGNGEIRGSEDEEGCRVSVMGKRQGENERKGKAGKIKKKAKS